MQLKSLRLHGKVELRLDTLLTDIRAVVIPNALQSTLVGHTDNVKSVAFDRGNPARLVSGSADATVRVWDVAKGTEVMQLAGHTSRVWEVDSLPSGQCVSASADATVRLWDAAGDGGCGKTVSACHSEGSCVSERRAAARKPRGRDPRHQKKVGW